MLEVLLSWAVILAAALIFGYTALKFFDRKRLIFAPDTCLLCGIMALTVYAEVFSIFYRVSQLACVLLAVCGLMLGLFWLMADTVRGGRNVSG